MRHVYVHVPFCRRRCSYCDFAIAVRERVPSDAFVRDLLRERDLRRDGDWADVPLETLYLGGGTPSRLAPDAIAAIVDAFACERGAEITLEANPENVTGGVARAWVDAGVNRVSLGVQSFHGPALEWMHRTHTVADVPRAYEALRAAGVAAVSVDLIFGLPAALERPLALDLDHVLALEPDHVSAYGLTVEPRTPLDRWIARGTVTPAPDERAAEEFLAIHERLTAEGYEHYEVSNYARPGRRARHNAACWQGAAYGGLGPAAHGFRDGARRWNEREWVAWSRRVAAGEDPMAGREVLTPGQRDLERIYLGLRTIEGVSMDRVRGPAPDGAWHEALRAGWLEVRGDRLVPTPEGWLRLDALLPFLTTSA